MGACFKFRDQPHWGSNGSIELYLETLAALASERWGADDPLALALRTETEGFFPGMIVSLDTMLVGESEVQRFAELLDAATVTLLGGDAFTDSGRQWVAREIRPLWDRLVASGAARQRVE